MRTYLHLKRENAIELPDEFKQDDVRFSDSLVQFFIDHYTKEHDVILDPFAGYGTTLIVAERNHRKAYGIELLQERVTYVRTLLRHKERILQGSVLKLRDMAIPPVDLVITSPPYMSQNKHAQYPLAGYHITGQTYSDYLQDIKTIFEQVKEKAKDGAVIVVEVSNIIHDDECTTLAWDIGKTIGEVLKLEKEMIICWEADGDKSEHTYGFGYDHSYCLIFKKE